MRNEATAEISTEQKKHAAENGERIKTGWREVSAGQGVRGRPRPSDRKWRSSERYDPGSELNGFKSSDHLRREQRAAAGLKWRNLM